MLQFGSDRTLLVRPDAFGMGYAQRGRKIAAKHNIVTRKVLQLTSKSLRMNRARVSAGANAGDMAQDFPGLSKVLETKDKGYKTDGKASWKSELGKARADRTGSSNRYLLRAGCEGIQADSGPVHSLDPASGVGSA